MAIPEQYFRNITGRRSHRHSLWKSDAVQITSGAEHVATFQKTPFSQRKYCRICGGHLMAGHQPAELGGSGQLVPE